MICFHLRKQYYHVHATNNPTSEHIILCLNCGKRWSADYIPKIANFICKIGESFYFAWKFLIK